MQFVCASHRFGRKLTDARPLFCGLQCAKDFELYALLYAKYSVGRLTHCWPRIPRNLGNFDSFGDFSLQTEYSCIV